jgi:hypothetical protein
MRYKDLHKAHGVLTYVAGNGVYCRKNQYPSKAIAEFYANQKRDLKLYSYECKVCRNWHLTKQKQN